MTAALAGLAIALTCIQPCGLCQLPCPPYCCRWWTRSRRLHQRLPPLPPHPPHPHSSLPDFSKALPCSHWLLLQVVDKVKEAAPAPPSTPSAPSTPSLPSLPSLPDFSKVPPRNSYGCICRMSRILWKFMEYCYPLTVLQGLLIEVKSCQAATAGVSLGHCSLASA